MNIDESQEQYAEMQLFYDVMEIGLAVMGPAGRSRFFDFIDNALDTFNISELRIIKESFDALSELAQHALVDGDSESEQAADALSTLQANCRELCSERDIKIA